jgi:hypothetical protein
MIVSATIWAGGDVGCGIGVPGALDDIGVGTFIINFPGTVSVQRHDPSTAVGHALTCTPNPEEPDWAVGDPGTRRTLTRSPASTTTHENEEHDDEYEEEPGEEPEDLNESPDDSERARTEADQDVETEEPRHHLAGQ